MNLFLQNNIYLSLRYPTFQAKSMPHVLICKTVPTQASIHNPPEYIYLSLRYPTSQAKRNALCFDESVPTQVPRKTMLLYM